MTKKILKIISVIFLFLLLLISYLSFFGIKTEVFNNEIKDSLSKINKEVKININEVSYLLNPLNFNLDITTENSEVLLKKHQLDLEKVKLNVSIKSLFKKKLLINKIKLSTKEIKLKNLIIPLREIYNSPQLFILNQIVKEGNIAIDVNINFDSQGKIKDDYQIKGLINKAKIDLLNKFTIKDLNFLFTVNKKKYELSKITSLLNEIKFSSPFIEIEPNEDSYLIKGKIKDDYQIKGFINKAKIDLLNKFTIKDLNFLFTVNKKKYELSKITSLLNEIKFSSPFIEIEPNEDSYLIKGKILSKDLKLESKDLENIFKNKTNDFHFKKTDFSFESFFSLNINNRLKIDNLSIKSNLNLDKAKIVEKRVNFKPYFLNSSDEIDFNNHKINIDYNKDQLIIEGNGKVSFSGKTDQVVYKFIKNDNKISFDTSLNIKNNPLIIKFLDYKKKEGVDSTILAKGQIENNGSIKFDLISLKENSNLILINNLNLSKTFKIIDIDLAKIEYKNNKNYLNRYNLKKINSNYIIKGDSLDLSKIINNIMDTNDNSLNIFNNFNSKIDVNIKKTFIDETNYINNLSGFIKFKNNKVDNLKLNSFFSNNKKISLTINTNKALETSTQLIADYPKPLIKRYDFIKGFEEGYLVFNSIKKDNESNSVLIIDNFKIQKVPIFAKILSLASLQGIADVLTGEGIRFTNFEMRFSNKKDLTTIEEIYAIGPAVSILMDGYIESKKLVSLRGTLVPATTINRNIASIPIIGDLLIGDKVGEGVFGVSFKIKGPPKDLSTTVNPIKTLTPRFITRTLEKLKKN